MRIGLLLFALLVTVLGGFGFTGASRATNGPSQWVEGTQALDDGATRDYYNRAARLPWDNFLGDWRDAENSPQGSSSYAHVDMVDNDTWEYIEWDVTELVQEWVDGTYPNQGFFVRLVSGSSTYYFRSREHTLAQERPELVVTTGSGSMTYGPEADTYLAGSTYQGLGDADRIRVASNENSLVRFDLSDIPAATVITRATLRLFVFGEFGSSTVGIFRSRQGHDEPSFRAILGLAADYPDDVGITDHPEVHFAAAFETSDWGDGWSYGTGASTLSRVYDEPGLQFQPLLGYALRVEIPQGTNTGMSVGFEFGDKLGYEPEEIYFRYYMRIADDWLTLDGGKFPGIAGTYGVAGWGGRQSNGYDGWSARGLFQEVPPTGNPLGDTVPVGSYVYHADMPTQYGDNHLWQNDYRGYLERNRWYCIEQYLQMNTPGLQDGIMRVWIDGHLAWEKTDWRWRHTPDLKIEEIWMNVYHGGTAPVGQDVHLYIDNVVIADEYIGPLGGLFSDDFESGDTSRWTTTVP
jgi:hypothetical protein